MHSVGLSRILTSLLLCCAFGVQAQIVVSDALVYDLEFRSGGVYWSDLLGEFPIQKFSDGEVTPLARRMGVPTGLTMRGGKLVWLESRSGWTPNCTGAGVIRILNQTEFPNFSTVPLWAGTDCAGSTTDIVATRKYLFWLSSVVSPEEFRIMRLDRETGEVVTFFKTSQRITALLGDADNLYWLAEQQYPTPSVIRRKPMAGGTASVVVKVSLPVVGSMAFSGNRLVYAVLHYPMGSRAELLRVPKAGGSAVKIAETNLSPRKLAANVAEVFWIDEQGLRSAPVLGGSVNDLADELMDSPYSPVDLTLTADTVYWLENNAGKGSLRAIALAGGAAVAVANNLYSTDRIAKGGDYIYWTEGGDYGEIEGFGRIARVPSAGGEIEPVAAGIMSDPLHHSSDTLNIAVAGEYVYVADKWTIKRVPINPGPTEIVATLRDQIGDLVSDGTYVYCTIAHSGSVHRVRVAGGKPRALAQLAAGGPSPRIRLAGGYLYWMTLPGTIHRIPKGGGTLSVVAKDRPFLSDFVADTDHVFFAEWDTGEIRKIPVTGGTSIELMGGCSVAPCSLAQSTADIYVVDQTQVVKTPKSSGNFDYLADTDGSPFLANSIAVGPSDVYWSDTYNGTINRMRRPDK